MADKQEKVTTMVLNVDLQCPKCYKKVKNVLSKVPQIRDQVYDEKANKVTIKVVCCSPEKIRDKLCYKGGGSIKSIEIKEPPKEPEKKKDGEKPKEKSADKPKDAEKPKEAKEGEKPKEAEKPKEQEKPKGEEKPKQAAPAEAAKPQAQAPVPTGVPIYYPPPAYPAMGFFCSECYRSGITGGPCPHGGTVVQYDGYYGRPVYDSWGGGGGYRGGYPNYFSEENQQGCSIM